MKRGSLVVTKLVAGALVAGLSAGIAAGQPAPVGGPRWAAAFATTAREAMADAAGGAARRPMAESERLTRAKDLISAERWAEAIPVLRAAVADPKEPARDEALFWLAHSQNEAGHLAESVESIRRLQRDFAGSRWTRPAQSLLIELAHKLGRQDVLWWTAVPEPLPAPPAPPAPVPGTPRPARAPQPPRATPPAQPAPPQPAPWFPDIAAPDIDLQLQALGTLLQSEAPKVIPILARIALDAENAGAARRAVFVLAQSRLPEAETIVLDVARRGAEPVRIAAVRELGRFGGPEIARELLAVYESANAAVKQQVVSALGERRDAGALLRIVRAEPDRQLQEAAIITLGRAGAREPLRDLYARARHETRRAIIVALFNARDEEGLIGIAVQEKDGALRNEARARLRLLGTPRAREFLGKGAR